MQRLTDRVAIITGAADGIGRAIALGLASEGAAVVLADSRQERLLRVQTELAELKRNFLALPTNISDEDSVRRLIEQSVFRFERIDILVNAASTRSSALVEDVTEQDWTDVIRTNLVGAFVCSKAVVPRMLTQRRGRIISFTSIEAFEGSTNGAHYSAAKAGIIGFSKALALELAPYQITVNTICADEDCMERPEISSGSHAEMEGSIGPAIFLASDAASYVTGQTLFVNSA
jgi:NAD(P)-dependent dehydrogenase (short-subunit alcohol dehydrogenase family)